MKLNTNVLKIEIENLLILFCFICIFSKTLRNFTNAYFICYLFILFHELAHILMAAMLNKKVDGIKLTLSGVCAIYKREYSKNIKTKASIYKNLMVYLAGPISNLIIAFMFSNVKMIFEINMFLAIINLIPIKPLDGYHISNCLADIIKIKGVSIFIENIFPKLIFIILIGLGIYQVVFFKIPSILLFICYVYLINATDKPLQTNKFSMLYQ